MLLKRGQHVETCLVDLRLVPFVFLEEELHSGFANWLLGFSGSLLGKAEAVKVFDKAQHLGKVHTLGPDRLGVARLQESCEIRILMP
jgi:hypothetical protein